VRTVFFDVDTQIDFMFPAGALYVPGAETIVARVAALNHFAAAHGIPVISTMDAHSEDDPEFRTWPHHCVVDTTGQQKPAATLLKHRVVVPNGASELNLEGAKQILLEKQKLDCFTNVNLAAVLDQLNADRYVVYGVVTEVCVKFAADGLLRTGRPVELVTDAIRGLTDDAESQIACARTTWSRLAAG
jgi:nicotinamidase/pyrazinamidase